MNIEQRLRKRANMAADMEEGEVVQYREGDGPWQELRDVELLFDPSFEFRYKPEDPGHPMNKEPEARTLVHFVDLRRQFGVRQERWDPTSGTHRNEFANGAVFRDREDAVAAVFRVREALKG